MRVAAALLAASLLASCQPESVTPSPSPTVSATPSRPRFELSTYPYTLQTRGKIRVAIRSGVAPMSDAPVSGNTIGKAQGFEPDLAREIAKAIFGTSDDPDGHIVWISVDTLTRETAVVSDQADISIGGVPITDDNVKVMDLSDPYFTVGQRLMVKKANDQIKEIADVATGEQTVCAVTDSKSAAELKKITNNGAKIIELGTTEFCMQALMSGAADAIVNDEVTLLSLIRKAPNDLKLVGRPFATTQLGIGMKKNAAGDRQGFREFVNTALLTIVASRTWAKIYEMDITPSSGDKKQLPTD